MYLYILLLWITFYFSIFSTRCCYLMLHFLPDVTADYQVRKFWIYRSTNPYFKLEQSWMNSILWLVTPGSKSGICIPNQLSELKYLFLLYLYHFCWNWASLEKHKERWCFFRPSLIRIYANGHDPTIDCNYLIYTNETIYVNL